MPGRQFSASSDYRYGFNGKENDTDLGSQLIQDYGFRLYNPAIGRFLSVDPLAPDYPFYTPYQFAGNRPIWAVDLDGLEDVQSNLEGGSKGLVERQKALAKAREFVDANPNSSPSLYGYAGYHKGKPGDPIDCSGMVSQCAKASGFGYLNTAVSNSKHKIDVTVQGHYVNGVSNIINQPLTRQIDESDVIPGDIVIMSNRIVTTDGIGVGHVAFVEEVTHNANGEIVKMIMLHSAGNSGPERRVVDLQNPKDYYNREYGETFTYWAWATPVDNPMIDKLNTKKNWLETRLNIVSIRKHNYDNKVKKLGKQAADEWLTNLNSTEEVIQRKLNKTRQRLEKELEKTLKNNSNTTSENSSMFDVLKNATDSE